MLTLGKSHRSSGVDKTTMKWLAAQARRRVPIAFVDACIRLQKMAEDASVSANPVDWQNAMAQMRELLLGVQWEGMHL